MSYQHYPQRKGDNRPSNQDMISHKVISVPNGITYLDGTQGMDHAVVFDYPDRVITHDGGDRDKNWKVNFKENAQ